MNGTILGVLLIIIIVAGLFYTTQITDLVKGAVSSAYINYATTATNTALAIQTKAGQQICSLKVVFNPFLAANVVPPIYARIDNGASQVSWYACHSPVPSLAMLVPNLNTDLQNGLTSMDLFGLFNPSSSGYHFYGTIVAPDGTQGTPLVNPVPATGLDNSKSGVGQTFTITFVFQNIPKQSYSLKIYSPDIGINQAGSGNTYTQMIGG